MKRIKKILIGTLILSMIVTSLVPDQLTQAASNNIKIGKYIELVINTIQAPVLQENKNPYIDAALNIGILESENEFDYDKIMTREECAVLTNRADIYVNGVSTNTKVFDEIKDHKRISDLSKIKLEYQDDVIQVFGKGIIVGYSNGRYTQNRSFKGNKEITYYVAKSIVKIILNKKLRKVMSPDGQLTRNTKLPCNAKEYEYILASFPNKFYEMMFTYETYMSNVKKKKYEDYARPIDSRKQKFVNSNYKGTVKDTQDILDKYLDVWVKKIENNLQCRFNVDYRTIDDDWYKQFLNSYHRTLTVSRDNDLKSDIKNYIKDVKKNKVIIKTKLVSVEPSTLYKYGSYYIRCYVKFKVVSAKNMKDIIEFERDHNVYFKNLKKNKWHDGYYDICISTTNGCSKGEDYGVHGEEIIDSYMVYKNHILKQKFNKKGNVYFANGYYEWK